MAQLPTRTSVMGRLPKAPQVPNGFAGLESCREGFSSSRLKCACSLQGGGLHAHFIRQEVILSTATSGPQKTSARKRAEKGALMTLIWGTLRTP